jgi:hypothetical protein
MCKAWITKYLYDSDAVRDEAFVNRFLAFLDEMSAVRTRTHTHSPGLYFTKMLYGLQVDDAYLRGAAGPLKAKLTAKVTQLSLQYSQSDTGVRTPAQSPPACCVDQIPLTPFDRTDVGAGASIAAAAASDGQCARELDDVLQRGGAGVADLSPGPGALRANSGMGVLRAGVEEEEGPGRDALPPYRRLQRPSRRCTFSSFSFSFSFSFLLLDWVEELTNATITVPASC